MTQRIILVSAVALINRKNQTLLAQRPKGKAMADLWEFPGGKIESGETPETALIREVEEELGIFIDSKNLTPISFASHAYPDFHLFMPLYGCRRWEGEIKKREHQQLEWVDADQLANYPMPEADLPLISPIMHFIQMSSLEKTEKLC